MTLHRLFQSLDAVIDVGISAIDDHDARLELLDYQRGLKSMLAKVIGTPDNVLQFDDAVLNRRLATAIADQRHRQVAHTRKLHHAVAYGVNEFGDNVYAEDID